MSIQHPSIAIKLIAKFWSLEYQDEDVISFPRTLGLVEDGFGEPLTPSLRKMNRQVKEQESMTIAF